MVFSGERGIESAMLKAQVKSLGLLTTAILLGFSIDGESRTMIRLHVCPVSVALMLGLSFSSPVWADDDPIRNRRRVQSTSVEPPLEGPEAYREAAHEQRLRGMH